MADEGANVSFEPFFGGFVLETLTIGMYGEARNAIREYIQNGFDSIQRAIHDLKILPEGDGLIEIEMAPDHKTLIIRDNGAGLPTKSAATILTRVGASSKSHEKNAGFRGIGRLAGIVFSDTVTFTTKALGEREETTVKFNAKAMRASMAPGKGSAKSALELMKESVVAFRSPNRKTKKHFFEVKLEGIADAPDECKCPQAMYNFVSQVAPVPYPENFPFRNKLMEAAEEYGIPIEEVKITIKNGNSRPTPITKRYIDKYKFESGFIALNDCEIYSSRTKKWWAWVGKKAESGSYTDTRVSGLRVRVRNIQIDGTGIIRDIFRDHAKSHVRFQDYFLGEVFVKPNAVVPNARRDGFEEDANWKRLRRELAQVVKQLGKDAYKVSKQGQISVTSLKDNLKKSKQDMLKLKKGEFSNTDGIIALSKRVTTYLDRIALGVRGADMETAAQLQAIGSAFTDIRQEALSHVANSVSSTDREKVQQEARDEFLEEILLLLEEALSPGCFAEVRQAIADEFEV